MLARTTLAFALLLFGSSEAAAQSNVRPAPRLVRVPEMGAKYLAPASAWSRRWRNAKSDPFASDYAALAALPRKFERDEFTHLELTLDLHPETQFENGPGSISTSRAGWSATMGERVNEESVFALTLEAESSFYDFSNAGALMAGTPDPFNDIYDTRLGVMIMQDATKSASWFTGAQLGLSGEDDADLGDAFSAGLVAGKRHQIDDTLSLSIGLIARTRLEDSPWLFPHIGFDWRVSESMRLTSTGSAVAAIFEVGETVELGLGAEYRARQYRLNDDSTFAGGVIEDEEIKASASFGWRPSHRVTLDLEAGLMLWREFASFTATGRKLTELETEPTEFGAVRLSVTF